MKNKLSKVEEKAIGSINLTDPKTQAIMMSILDCIEQPRLALERLLGLSEPPVIGGYFDPEKQEQRKMTSINEYNEEESRAIRFLGMHRFENTVFYMTQEYSAKIDKIFESEDLTPSQIELKIGELFKHHYNYSFTKNDRYPCGRQLTMVIPFDGYCSVEEWMQHNVDLSKLG